MLNIINTLLEECSSDKRKFPATDLYCEGWMLRIVLDWFSKNVDIRRELSMRDADNWYSEARLPSTFLPRKRGDKLAEGHTHADGVIGEFTINKNLESELVLKSDAKSFIVIEAKMFSKLSPRTSNCSYYDQAARNVGCIAEVLRRANLKPDNLEKLAFYVIAPESRIKENVFTRYMEKEHIFETVKRRVDEYDESKIEWHENWFIPLKDVITIKCISWEEIIEFIVTEEPKIELSIKAFYANCLKHNQLISNLSR